MLGRLERRPPARANRPPEPERTSTDAPQESGAGPQPVSVSLLEVREDRSVLGLERRESDRVDPVLVDDLFRLLDPAGPMDRVDEAVDGTLEVDAVVKALGRGQPRIGLETGSRGGCDLCVGV